MRTPCARLGLVIIALLSQNVGAAVAQQSRASSDAERVWTRYAAALGGKAWHDVRTREVRGSFEYRGVEQHGAGSFDLRWKSPRRVVMQLRAPMGTVIRGLNGARAWGTHPQTGIRRVSALEIDEMLLEAALYQPAGVRHWYRTLTYEGRMKVDGRDTEVLSGLRHGGAADRFYFDVETGLPIRLDVWEEGPEAVRSGSADQSYLAHYELGDYRKTAGVEVPFLIRRRRPNSTMTFRLTVVRHNVALPDSLFRAP